MKNLPPGLYQTCKFLNNEQKLTNDSVRKEQIVDFKKRQIFFLFFFFQKKERVIISVLNFFLPIFPLRFCHYFEQFTNNGFLDWYSERLCFTLFHNVSIL